MRGPSLLAAPVPKFRLGVSVLLFGMGCAACDGCTASSMDGGPGADGGALLVINELMASNASAHRDEFGEPDDWIELHNRSEQAIDLEGFTLSDDASQPDKHTFRAGVEIPAGGFLVVFADRQPFQGPLHADFRLAREGEEVVLTAPSGAVVDHVLYGEQFEDRSAGRFPDGEGDVVLLSTPTPGTPNTSPRDPGGPSDAGSLDGGDARLGDGGSADGGVLDAGLGAEGVVLNELLATPLSSIPDADGDLVAFPWVELKNTSAAPRDVSRYYLSDDADDLMKSPIAGSAVIAPGEHFLVFGNSEPAREGLYHGTFRLRPEGGTLFFVSPSGQVIDQRAYGAQLPGRSEGRAPDGSGPFTGPQMPSPREENAGVVEDAGVVDDAGAIGGAGANDDAGVDSGVMEDAGA